MKPGKLEMQQIKAKLEERGIQASSQRCVIAFYCLNSHEHPSADQVLKSIQKDHADISRATVYNTLNLFVEKGLLKEVPIEKDKLRYDPLIEKHHHFYDTKTKKIYDIPWNKLKVDQLKTLSGKFKVNEYQVLLKGTHS